MIPYWLLFLLPAYLAVTQLRPVDEKLSRWSGSWYVAYYALLLMIGLRDHVGGDWYTYLDQMYNAVGASFQEVLLHKETAYNLANWLDTQTGWGIYLSNTVCAAVFSLGLVKLCREQPHPWLALVVAIPYLTIVVAMGYTRQAAAIGVLMYSYEYLLRGRIVAYSLLVLLAGLFHQTAFVFIAFSLFRPGSGLFKRALGFLFLIVLVAGTYVVDQAETFMVNYVDNPMKSEGGAIRVYMNFLPALFLLVYWKKWGEKFDDRWFWGLIAVFSIACVPLVSIASTAVDRMALYLIPLQIVVWSRFPVLLKGRIPPVIAILIVILYYAAVQFVWLVYGVNSPAWVPYGSLLFPSF